MLWDPLAGLCLAHPGFFWAQLRQWRSAEPRETYLLYDTMSGQHLDMKLWWWIADISHDGYMVLPYMVTWIPLIYPSHVSIFLPAPWIRHGIYKMMYPSVIKHGWKIRSKFGCFTSSRTRSVWGIRQYPKISKVGSIDMSLSQNLRPRDHRCAAIISCPCAFARNIGLKRWKEKTLHSYVHPSRYVVDSYDRSSSQIYDSSEFSRSPPQSHAVCGMTTPS